MVAGQVASVDPEAWKIVDGKLYLGYSKASSKRWAGDAEVNIKKADENWRKLRQGK